MAIKPLFGGGGSGGGGGAFVVAQRFGMCMFMCMTRVHCTTHKGKHMDEQLPQH